MSRKITIIGGGLAGISLGIGLRQRGIPAQLIEAGQYPRHRVCGEFISGISAESLRFIGIEDVFDGYPRHTSTVWFYGNQRALASDLPTPAIGVSRYRLDKELIDRFVALGGELHTGSRYAGDENEGHVYATGRVRRKGSQWMGIKCHLINFPLEADLEMHMGEGTYMGLSGVEDNRVDACGIFKLRPDVKAPRLELMTAYLDACGLSELAEKIKQAEKDESSCLGVNAFELGWQPDDSEDDGKLRIGDRFAIIGPFSGNGMSMAFESAASSIDPLVAWSNGETDWSECRKTVSSVLSKRFKKRIAVSNFIHPFLTDGNKQKFTANLAQLGLIPYTTLFKVLR